jgi:E3 SUMO-protein ligase PIAS1
LEKVRNELVRPLFVGSHAVAEKFMFDIDYDRSRYEVQVRCVKVDSTGFAVQWPKCCSVSINGRRVWEVKASARPKARKRRDTSLNVSCYVIKGENSFAVSKRLDDEAYVAGVYLVEKKSEGQLIQEVLDAPRFSRESSVATSKTYAVVVAEPEVQSRGVRVSLRCPYSLMLLNSPAKGTACRHPQCFSLESFIYMQKASKVNRWRCPFCKRLVTSLQLDDLFSEIMRKAALYHNPEFVEISAEGTFEVLDYEGNLATLSEAKHCMRAVVLPSKRVKTEAPIEVD